MPRRKKPPIGSGPVARLAREMQELRRQAGLTYDAMVPRAHFSKTTLATADAGDRLPTWHAVKRYVIACGGDVEHFRGRWQEAAWRVGPAPRLRPAPSAAPARPGLPDPVAAGSVDEYLVLLRLVRDWAGRPTYRELSARARRGGRALPRSTLGDLLTGRRTVGEPFLRTYLAVCGLTVEEVELWVKMQATLSRVTVDSGRSPLPAGLPAEPPAGLPDSGTPAPAGPAAIGRCVLAVATVMAVVLVAAVAVLIGLLAPRDSTAAAYRPVPAGQAQAAPVRAGGE